MSSNNLDKYEYLTGEDLDLKPSTLEQAKFEYSPLGKIFNKGLDKEEDKKEGLFKRLENMKDKNEELIKLFSKASKNKLSNKDKQNKNLVYNSQHSFAKFKDIDEIKELSLSSMHKTLKNFNKKLTGLKNVIPRTKANKILKEKVLDNAENLFNDLYYIYKDKYNEEINSLDTENRKRFDYKKLRLTDDYLYPSEEEEQQTSKNFNKKEPPKKPTKTDFDELNEQIIEEETETNKELFKNYFIFQKPTPILKNLYDLNDKNKNKQFVDVIKSGLIDLKNEIKKMSEDDIKIEKPYKIVETVEKILEFNQ